MKEPRFYVYELIDPRDGSVFYVGKGQAKRYLEHLKEALRGVRSRKCSRIRSIIECGHVSYDHRIASRHHDEDDAYDAEVDLISSHGLENLTNVLPGGGHSYVAKSGWSRRLIYRYRDTVKHILVLMASGRIYAGDRDVTSDFEKLLMDMIDGVGQSAFKEEMGKCGVEIAYA